MVCAYVKNLLGNNINTIKKNTEALIDARKEVILEVKAEKSKYMLMSHHRNAMTNHNVTIANRFMEMCQSSNIWERR
jgi:hypothetical protein